MEKKEKKEKGRDILLIINPRLQQNRLRPRIRQPSIMHQRTQPYIHPVRSPIFLLPNKQMNTPIIVTQTAQQRSQAIFLRPIDLEVPEGLPVPASEDREAVARGEVVAQEFLLVLDGACLTPCGIDAGVIHPIVEDFEVCWAVFGLGLLHADGGGGREGVCMVGARGGGGSW